jgi:two-component system CheB/CheR fusion protein
LQSKPFEIQRLLQSNHSNAFGIKVNEKNLELESQFDQNLPTILVGDSLRLNQIISNLITNAIRITHKGKIELCSALNY